MPLQFIKDDLDDRRHLELDKSFYESLGITIQNFPHLPSTLVSWILRQFVNTLPGNFDKKYANMEAVEQLVNENPELEGMVQQAWTARTFRSIRNLEILHVGMPRRPNRPHKPEDNIEEQTTVTPPVSIESNITDPNADSPDIAAVKASIADFVKMLRPKIKTFLNRPRFPVWIPPNTVDEKTSQFYRDLAIPSMKDGGPNLLLHNLGNESNPNVANLFRAKKHCILYNTSGAGKTRLLFEGLCKHWGFYFVAQQDVNGIGAKDLEFAIDRMSNSQGWVNNIFKMDDIQGAGSANEAIAFNRVFKVLLARWTVFRVFLEVSKEQYAGKLPDRIKHDWLLFQILPLVLIGTSHTFLAFMDDCLLGVSSTILKDLLAPLTPGKVFGPEFQAESENFFYVVDEAQVAGNLYTDAFTDVNVKFNHPVLRPIIRAWKSAANWDESIRFIVSGTGFSFHIFETVLESGVGKERAVWDVVHTTGDFENRQTQESYIMRYLPPPFLHSSSGIALRTRMYEWLRGRHRFTAKFLEELLRGTWMTNAPSSPHKLLNKYVHVFTDFTPLDGDDVLLATEPEVQRLDVEGFLWEKLDQEESLLEKLSTSIYIHMTRGEYPIWYKEGKVLVESGLARFIGEGDKVVVEEPMALVSIGCHFETQGFVLERAIRAHLQSEKGLAFEEAVLLSCTRLFRRGARLDDVFEFHGNTPAWARQAAWIVTQGSGKIEVFDIVNWEPDVPSGGIAYYAKDPKDVQGWIESMSTGWCLPGVLMGPDLMAWLRLNDGRLLLLLIQAKCYLEENIDTIEAEVTAKAIRSLNPDGFYATLTRKTAANEIADMLAAINDAGHCFTGARYNILRVVAACPLAANIDPDSSIAIKSALSDDKHPLATLKHAPLFASLSTYDSTPSILSCLKKTLKRARGQDDEDKDGKPLKKKH